MPDELDGRTAQMLPDECEAIAERLESLEEDKRLTLEEMAESLKITLNDE